MKTILALACLLAMLAPAAVRADDSEFQPRALETASDYDNAKKAIDRKDWIAAITLLDKAAKRDPKDADVQNLLGYSHRRNGNLKAAFLHYGRALELNPKHLGAHEYVGEAYLMARDPRKAREHLASLERLCPATCKERDALKKAIAEFEKNPSRTENSGGRSPRY